MSGLLVAARVGAFAVNAASAASAVHFGGYGLMGVVGDG